ncbi:hypothetical protein BG011_005703 [Mortierella polycephala]|uniref:PQ-loop-domain-containing protein n=1 Tax=Mortierella polycephala TaxID=41804 RepID=A0A9P6QGL0_9FUNG|nr:hypothetical protein BG011_005703 [Mortierella polycephala]
MALHTILFWLTRHSVTAASSDFAIDVFANATSNAMDTTDMPTHVVLSSVAGSLSILCWFTVFTPKSWRGTTPLQMRKAAKAKAHVAAAEYNSDTYNELRKGLGITIARSKAQGSAHYPPPPPSFLSASASSDRTRIPEEDDIVEETGQYRITEPQETTTLLGKSHLSTGSHHFDYQKGYSTIETPASSAAAAEMPGGGLSSQERALEQGTLYRTTSYATSTKSSDTTTSKRPLLRRRRVPRILLISLPILAIAFFTWSYLKWQDCVLNEHKRHGHGHDLDHIQGLQDLDMAGAADQWMLGWRVCRREQEREHDELPPSEPSHIFSDEGDSDGNGSGDGGESGITTALLLGWGGAVLYLGSRIPQIYKNWRLQSCEGLSLMMFIFSVLGNAFYVASIFLDSLEPNYLFRNMPWWLGACGTLVLDFTIFTQFFLYQGNQVAKPTEDD